MELRRRHSRDGQQPLAYPAWRVFEDRRVRADDSIMAVLTAVRMARVGLDDRAAENPETRLANELYRDEEVPYRRAFRVTIEQAHRRWNEGEIELIRLAVVLGVATLDDLLGSSITLLRSLGYDSTEPGMIDTGLSKKLRHLIEHGELAIETGTCNLHDLAIAMRNAVAHAGSRQKPVIDAWRRLGQADVEWWTRQAGRELPLSGPEEGLHIDDRELVAAFKTMDRVSLEMNAQLSGRVETEKWAELAVAEYRAFAPTKANNPQQNSEGRRDSLSMRGEVSTWMMRSLKKHFADNFSPAP